MVSSGFVYKKKGLSRAPEAPSAAAGRSRRAAPPARSRPPGAAGAAASRVRLELEVLAVPVRVRRLDHLIVAERRAVRVGEGPAGFPRRLRAVGHDLVPWERGSHG